jgi:cytochrome c oxidase cbb3-type subunit III
MACPGSSPRHPNRSGDVVERAGTTTLALAVCGLLPGGCQREERDYRPSPPFQGEVRFEDAYQRNAYALSEGKRLYSAFNCKGCHSEGGGAIGPPLMDEQWLYGAEPEQVFDTISKGRPNGMPAFGGAAREPGIKVVGTVPEYQIWQLAAYVRSLAGLAPRDAAPGRNDHMQTAPPENERPPQPPVVAPPSPDMVPPK